MFLGFGDSFRPSVVFGSVVAIVLAASFARVQAAEPADPLLQMVAELLSNPDRDLRALGLQHVREAAPGEAATKQFAALLPKL